MTVLFTILSPAQSMDADRFHDHWRHPHGTLGARLGAVRAYVQNHRVRPAGIPVLDDVAEGVVRVELHDGATAASIGDDPLYRDHLSADEQRFADPDQIRPFATEIIALGPVREGMPASTPSTVGTDELADSMWTPETATSALSLIRFTAEERPACTESSAQEIGALWHAAYEVTGAPSTEPHTRFIEQYWWPTVDRCRRFAETTAWRDLAVAPARTRVVLASCERLL